MKYLSKVFSIALIMLFLTQDVRAGSSSVVISEVQTGDTVSLSDEFVELYNSSLSDVDLTDWTLEYKSATGASWTKKTTLVGSIHSYGYFLLAPSTYLIADGSFSAGLSGVAGQVRIKDKDGVVVDTLGWGATANAAEASPALAPSAGQSLERLPGRLLEDGGNASDTDDNSKDFVIRTSPQAQTSTSAMEVPGTPSESEEVTEDETGPVAKIYLPLMITELLPDPAAPTLDSRDEFIELFNPNSVDVDLEGYVLQAGSNFHDYYVLPATTIKAGGYLALFSADTHMSLTNAGGAARLLDPNGSLAAQVGEYPKAETGASWSLIDGSWAWSLAATPAVDNVLTELEKPVTKTAAVASVKKTPKPKVTTTKPKSTKVAKAATAKKTPASKAKSAVSKAAAPLVAAVSSPSSFWLLTLAGVLTLGLIAYEFRFDLQNYYFLARRKFGPRPKDR